MVRRVPLAAALHDAPPKRALNPRKYLGLVASRERHTPLSLFILYGPVTALYIAGMAFVIWGPSLPILPILYDWVVRYALVGFVMGVTVFGRLWLRQWLLVWAWRHKRSAWIGRKPSPPRNAFSSERYVLGNTLTLIVVVFLSLFYGAAMVIFWSLFLPAEVGIWTETRARG